MKKEILLPALALAGGGVGFVLRRTELAAAYDPVTRLMHTGHPATWLLAVLVVVLLAVFTVACRGAGKQQARDLFRAPGATGYMVLIVSASLIVLGAAGLTVRGLMQPHVPNVMLTVGAVLGLPGAVGALMAGRAAYRAQWSDYVPLYLMGPAFCTLAWLVVEYQFYAREPEIQLFMWHVLAYVSVVLAVYNQVSLALNKGCVYWACVLGLMGIFLSVVTLADGGQPAHKLISLFSCVYLMGQMYMLLRNAFGTPWPERMPLRAEKEDDDDDEEKGIRPLFGPKE